MPRKRNIYEMNYARLEALLGQAPEAIEPGRVYRLRSEGFMDLVVEKLSPSPTQGATLISLAHYFEQGGDLCQDPEMVVRVFPPGLDAFQELAPSTDQAHGRVEALLFQQALPPVFDAVYPRTGQFSPRLKRSLNAFLGQWLRNLREQGHRIDASGVSRSENETGSLT